MIGTSPEELGFDLEALRRKYAEERDKRFRPEGLGQFRGIEGQFARYMDDPYVEPVTRDALNEDLDALVIGAGIGGMVAAVRLHEAGITNFRIVDKAGDFGGTWYWNRFPGAQCDIESYIYIPLIEETGNHIPSQKYAHQPEIFEHCQRIGRHFDLYSRACFQTQFSDARWDDEIDRWIVTTDRGDRFRARFVVMSSGPLNRPKFPGIPGIETFQGGMFHTSRWDYGYTGGDVYGGLHKLADKRVGIIGTGATAIQCVPHLGRDAQQLYVFQRTPSSVDERGQKPTDPEWVKSLQPGWQRARSWNFCAILSGIPVKEDLVNDQWTSLFRMLGELVGDSGAVNLNDEEAGLLAEIADFRKTSEIRARVDRVVEDLATAEKLKAWYGQWCKRPCFSDDYLPTFNRPNVTLVDTEGAGVQRITEHSVIANDMEYEIDCLIFATGFEVGTVYTRRGQFEMHGRDGKTLSEHWAEGLRTYHGLLSHGFPNAFHMGFTQSGLSPNFTYGLDGQATQIAHLITEMNERGATTIEPTPEAEAAWVDLILAPNPLKEYYKNCTPGYYNGEGTNKGVGYIESQYPGGAVPFFEMLARWREEGTLEGLILK